MKARLIGTAALLALAVTAGTAGSARATTLEVGEKTTNGAIQITASLKAGSTISLSSTSGVSVNTCTDSHLAADTKAPVSGTKVTGPVLFLTFETCHSDPVVVDTRGNLYIEWTANTTGNLFSEEAVVTVPITDFPNVSHRCATGTGTKIGTVHGVASGNATITINAVINCGFLLPTAKWTGSYTITSPSGLGISQ